MSDLDRQSSGIHVPEEPEEARELRTSKNRLAQLAVTVRRVAEEQKLYRGDTIRDLHEAADVLKRLAAAPESRDG